VPKTKKPTVPDILDLYADCERRYQTSGIYDQFDEDERFYELDFAEDLGLLAGLEDEGIVLPSARDLVDACCDNSDIYNPRVWVNRKGESKKSEEEQNLLRKFGLGVLYRNNVEATISPIRVGSKHYWIHGLSVLKTVWDADRWLDKPERNENEDENTYAARVDKWRAERHDSIPIVIRAVHPQSVMLDPYYEGGKFVFETREELCYNVGQSFPGWDNPKSRKSSDKVEHISFWTPHYRCELYDREPVLGKRWGGVASHTYGFIPYVPIDTGLGNVSHDNDLAKRYVGILRYIRDLLISESRDYSYGDVILKYEAFPWGYLKGANTQGVTEIFKKFGEYNALPDGVEIVDMNPKVPPEALLTWMGVAANYLSNHAAPPAVRGLGEQGVRSGADRRLMIAQAAVRYQYANEAFKHGVAKVLSNCARIMKNVVPGNINVWARTPTDEFDIEIDKDKMKEPFTFYVEFAPISEEDEYRRHDDLERLFKSGLVTKRWARKQMSNVDFESLEIDEEVEKVKESPAIQQIIDQYVAGKLMEAISKRNTAESVENPPPMTPSAMNVPQQATNMAQNVSAPGRRLVPPIPAAPNPMEQQLAAMRSQVPMTQQGQTGGGNR